jgi:adenylylsulfate kinase
MVIWIIGLSASGKSTIAELVYKNLKLRETNTVLIDGDTIRDLFGNDVDHSVEGRAINAARISRLSKFLGDQNINVVAAVLSIFPNWQDWNRENISHYFEVFIDVEMETLKRRDPRALYEGFFSGKIKNVVGCDIPFPTPTKSDLKIDNNIDRVDFTEIAELIIKNIRFTS